MTSPGRTPREERLLAAKSQLEMEVFELKATVKGLVVAYEALEEGQTAPPPLGKVRRSTKKKNERQSHSSICLSVCLSWMAISDGLLRWVDAH